MTHLSAGDVVKFILSVHTAVMQCVRGEGVEKEGERGREVRREAGGGERDQEEDMESSEGDSDKG